MKSQGYDVEEFSRKRVEKAFLVGVQRQDQSEDDSKELIDELAELADTFGVDVVGFCIAKLGTPSAKYFIGEGKAESIVELAKMNEADVIIFDDPLTPAQQRSWENLAGMTVIDREEVILDIFADRAQTREAVLQVELARMNYDKSRLKRRWTHLDRSRSGGSSGSGGGYIRGTGEQQIEIDSRLIRQRIFRLQEELRHVQSQRQVQRKHRLSRPFPVAAIIGYTNAGKSSLLNSMTGSDVLVEDKLFATLDPTVRRIKLNDKLEILLADTVGLIRKLPHQLVEAFKSTLEETQMADILVEVLDIKGRNISAYHEQTQEVMKELDVMSKPLVTVFNKIDLIDDDFTLRRFKRLYPDAVFISTHTGEGLDELQTKLAEIVSHNLSFHHLKIPAVHYRLVAQLQNGMSRIISQTTDDEGATELEVFLHPKQQHLVQDFIIS